MVQITKVSLSESSKNWLRKLKGKVVRGISITTAGLPDKQHESAHNMGFLLWVSLDEENYAIYSNLTDSGKGISFPELVVSSGDQYPNNDGYLKDKEGIQDALAYAWSSTKVVSIKIVRDKVALSIDGDFHELEVDIGLKLRFEEDELLIMARNSSLGLMEF
ncbi:hypothetical protein [Tumebacillus lipolyticus]|uniref:Uncharacterized protein n=1 Tax=Tumebacillus lipolyticus TaxID=1280370 RepID=A0ABW5A1Q8_9BACL